MMVVAVVVVVMMMMMMITKVSPLLVLFVFFKNTYVYILSSCWLLNEHDNNAPPVPTDGFSKLLGGGQKIFFPTG